MISEGTEVKLPVFLNHQSARKYFKDRFQELFMMQYTSIKNGVKVYHYHLIKDKETYIKKYKDVRKGKDDPCRCFVESYQELDVTENGQVTIVS